MQYLLVVRWNRNRHLWDRQILALLLFLLFLRGKIRISEESKRKFKDKVRGLTIRNNPKSMFEVTKELNRFLQGWVGYFKIQEFKRPLQELDKFVRNRIRSMQLKKWKKPKKFQRMMIRAGYKIEDAKSIWVKMNCWQSVNRKEVLFTLNLEWFRRSGLIFLSDYINRQPELNFSH